MPAQSPTVAPQQAAQLQSLGTQIRAQRTKQKLSATALAEAAGLSRVTLHRIERGEPSVTLGAYAGVISALGLELKVRQVRAPISPIAPFSTQAPEALTSATNLATTLATPAATVRLADYPQLKQLTWHMHGVTELPALEALNLYERNWRHLDHSAMLDAERALIKALAARGGGGRPLV